MGARQAGIACLSQTVEQFITQGTLRQGVEAGVNGLGGDPPLRDIRTFHCHFWGHQQHDRSVFLSQQLFVVRAHRNS